MVTHKRVAQKFDTQQTFLCYFTKCKNIKRLSIFIFIPILNNKLGYQIYEKKRFTNCG